MAHRVYVVAIHAHCNIGRVPVSVTHRVYVVAVHAHCNIDRGFRPLWRIGLMSLRCTPTHCNKGRLPPLTEVFSCSDNGYTQYSAWIPGAVHGVVARTADHGVGLLVYQYSREVAPDWVLGDRLYRKFRGDLCR